MFSAFFVDDEQSALALLAERRIFRECGFRVTGCSTSPAEAVFQIKTINPDVVFTDLKMPGLSGIQLMEHLKAENCTAEFVIVSAYSELNDVRHFFSAHGYDYLVKPATDEELFCLLSRLSDKLGDLPLPLDIVTPSRQLNEILAYLRKYYTMPHTLEDLGNRFDLNPNSICNLFARHMDTTFITYLTSLRMEHAEKLLLNTDKPIKEIAAVCGFNDYFYFCRVFCKLHGCAPTRFRREGGI